jgi:hypothetical protein
MEVLDHITILVDDFEQQLFTGEFFLYFGRSLRLSFDNNAL